MTRIRKSGFNRDERDTRDEVISENPFHPLHPCKKLLVPIRVIRENPRQKSASNFLFRQLLPLPDLALSISRRAFDRVDRLLEHLACTTRSSPKIIAAD